MSSSSNVAQTDSWGWSLKPFADSVWTAATPVRFAGVWFPHVMTVVRFSDDQLVVHSPCRPYDQLTLEIGRIGHVAHIIAPNWFHDLYLNKYRQLYPQATVWGPSQLRRRLGSKLIDQELNNLTRPPWFAEMPHLTLSGLLTFDESIFFHGPSRTLIVADLLMNLLASPTAPRFTWIAYRLSGVNDRLIMPPYLRWFGWFDPQIVASLNSSARQITMWNPDHLIVGHGVPVREQAMPRIRSALTLTS
jgi:hypothetical protein